MWTRPATPGNGSTTATGAPSLRLPAPRALGSKHWGLSRCVTRCLTVRCFGRRRSSLDSRPSNPVTSAPRRPLAKAWTARRTPAIPPSPVTAWPVRSTVSSTPFKVLPPIRPASENAKCWCNRRRFWATGSDKRTNGLPKRRRTWLRPSRRASTTPTDCLRRSPN